MYVDDVIGVGMSHHISSDIQRARHICTDLLGPNAMADEKTEQGRRLDIIGYTIDLHIARVLISEKNILIATNGFATTDLNSPISIKSSQRLAS